MVGPIYTDKFNSKRSSGAAGAAIVNKRYSRTEYIKEFGGSQRMGNRRAHLL